MEKVRSAVSEGLQMRADAGIKVRQPLASFSLPLKGIPEEYHSFILEELNVKELKDSDKYELDIELTDKLKEEGQQRDFLRMLQQMRKKRGLSLEDRVTLVIGADTVEVDGFFDAFREELSRVAGVEEIRFDQELNEGEVFSLDAKNVLFSIEMN